MAWRNLVAFAAGERHRANPLERTGGDLSAFPSAIHFASSLGVCPDNCISGGKVLSARTKPTTNRVAHALRMAAQALHHAQNELGEHYRRLRAVKNTFRRA